MVWRIHLLGGLEALRGDRRVNRFPTRKTAALLAYLAFHGGRVHPRELLADLLWPGEDPAATRARLRTALVSLRQIFEPADEPPASFLCADRNTVQLRSDAFDTDVALFETALESARRPGLSPGERREGLWRATQLYSGELLPGHYEEWIQPHRERLNDQFLEALTELAELEASAGDAAAAVECLRQAVSVDPLREPTRAQLIRHLAGAGRRAEAVRHYRELERMLREELGVRPSLESRGLFRDLELDAPEAASLGTDPGARPGSGAADEAGASDEANPVGGAIPLGSRYYLERRADAEFHRAVQRRDSIVLLKGPRQVGKTSLLARGLQLAREAGARVVLTDFQKMTADQLRGSADLFLSIAEALAEELELDVPVRERWDPERGWSVNFERFLRREVLQASEVPLVWGLDEVDRLFAYPFAGEVFGLFRSWHNERALRPAAPWRRLTLAIAYATEAHLFITDLHQSPFNVGTRLELEDFTLAETAELSRRYGAPLGAAELSAFHGLLGGQPYLTQCGLRYLVEKGDGMQGLEAAALQRSGPFGDHLRRMLQSLCRDADLTAAVKQVLRQGSCPSEASFYRLRTAGVILGDGPGEARPRCRLYRMFLEASLA